MITENFIRLYENSFRQNWDLPCLTEFPTKQTITYGEFAKEIASTHLLFQSLGIKPGDKIENALGARTVAVEVLVVADNVL